MELEHDFMSNYLDKTQGQVPKTSYHIKAYRNNLNLLQQKEIPETWPALICTKPLTIREEIIGYCGYCLLAYDWIRPLAKWIGKRKCLEIMCGSGSLSKSLQNCGVDIKATDDHSWNQEHAISWFVDPWTEIEQLNAIQAIETYGKDIDFVVCSWPFLSEDCYYALLKMREVNSNSVMIYIGEWHGGGTASDSFFETAQCVQDETFEEAVQKFKSIFGVHDKPYLIK